MNIILVVFIVYYVFVFLLSSLLFLSLSYSSINGILQALWVASIVPFLLPIDQIYRKTSWSNTGVGIRDSLIPMGMTTISCEEDETKTKEDCVKKREPEPLYPVKY